MQKGACSPGTGHRAPDRARTGDRPSNPRGGPGRGRGASHRKVDVEVVNVVATASFAHPIDLRVIQRAFAGEVQWNPKQFPGLVFRLKRPKTATLIFTSG
ncbi:TPA: hypothetical protein EYP44_02525, partial [Candidatus Bathyarchaeota archaeon]|nr:hypothetical protein [Candidatus Bathyarchaeota archaeon]